MAFDLLEPVHILSGNVIETGHVFAKKRFKNKYTWTPSLEMEAAIVNEIFRNA